MPGLACNIGLGRIVEFAVEDPTKFLIVLLTAAEVDADIVDHETLEALLNAAGNTELADASYARKTGLTGTVVLDDALDRQDVTLPDQTWVVLAGGQLVSAVVCYEKSASDAGRIPCTIHPWPLYADGADAVFRWA